MNNSQLKIIENKLNTSGMVTRNWALDRRITRLAALIYSLKKSGYRINAKFNRGNYIYSIR